MFVSGSCYMFVRVLYVGKSWLLMFFIAEKEKPSNGGGISGEKSAKQV